MTLADYIKASDRHESLANSSGYNKLYIYQVASGRRRGSPKFARDMEKHTAGEVMRSSLRPDIWGEDAT